MDRVSLTHLLGKFASETSSTTSPAGFERVTLDTSVRENAAVQPVASRQLEIARHKVMSAARRAGTQLKQTPAKESKSLRRRAGAMALPEQFKRLRRVLKRQRTVLSTVLREAQRTLCELPADRHLAKWGNGRCVACCAANFNIRWLLRASVRLGVNGLLLHLLALLR